MNSIPHSPAADAGATPEVIAHGDEASLLQYLDEIERRQGSVPPEIAEQVSRSVELRLERLRRIQKRLHTGLRRDIERHLERWKDEEGNLIMVLHAIQNEHGYIPREVAMEVSRVFGVKLARIYEVITFYHYFRLHPPGQHTVTVCNGTACYLKGAQELINEVRARLGVAEGQTTADRKYHFDVVRCIGCCGMSPAVVLDGKTHGRLKACELAPLLNAMAAGEAQP